MRSAGKSVCDFDTLQAIITHRYEVLMKFNLSVKSAYAKDCGRINPPPRLESWVGERVDTLDAMETDLSVLWESRAATREELLQHLRNWCQRAETSAIAPLQQFARELRCYG